MMMDNDLECTERGFDIYNRIEELFIEEIDKHMRKIGFNNE